MHAVCPRVSLVCKRYVCVPTHSSSAIAAEFSGPSRRKPHLIALTYHGSTSSVVSHGRSAQVAARNTDHPGMPLARKFEGGVQRRTGISNSEAWFPEGKTQYGEHVRADLLIAVRGSKRNGKLRVLAIKHQRNWRLPELTLDLSQPEKARCPRRSDTPS
jgi:Cytochrome oxidase complex assembly protein 1